MISILMPIYNGIEFIDQSILSIIDQTYTNWELIIAINGHPENSDTYKRAKEFCDTTNPEKIRVFDFYNIKGKSKTLNQMIKYCTYDYIALLDVDDIWHKDKLKIQSEYLDKYDVIGSSCIYFGDMNGIVPKIPLGDISNFDFKQVNPIINSSVIIRKEFCHWDISGIDGVEDYDLWLRLRKHNKTFYNCKQILVKHRIHQTSAYNAKGNNNLVDELLRKY